MESIEVLGKYRVHIGQGLLKNLESIIDLNEFSGIIVISDDKVPAEYLNYYKKIIVSSGESNKNIKTVEFIWKKLLEYQADRKSLVINLGGGVVGDMGGFAAATYMRGISFIQVPTTLLSSVDASVGGKVGIDFAGIKNLIGAFNQPRAVIIDIDTFKSLPEREFISGFGEIIKHGIISDPEYFKLVTLKKPAEYTKEELIEIIKKSCQIKAEIISSDEKESGNRKLLNFGHTIGHALESASLETDKPLLHGEAVSIGMVAEAKISLDKALIGESDLNKIKQSLINADLPVTFKLGNPQEILTILSSDKKSESGKVKWTLIEGVGKAVTDQEVSPERIIKALEYVS